MLTDDEILKLKVSDIIEKDVSGFLYKNYETDIQFWDMDFLEEETLSEFFKDNRKFGLEITKKVFSFYEEYINFSDELKSICITIKEIMRINRKLNISNTKSYELQRILQKSMTLREFILKILDFFKNLTPQKLEDNKTYLFNQSLKNAIKIRSKESNNIIIAEYKVVKTLRDYSIYELSGFPFFESFNFYDRDRVIKFFNFSFKLKINEYGNKIYLIMTEDTNIKSCFFLISENEYEENIQNIHTFFNQSNYINFILSFVINNNMNIKNLKNKYEDLKEIATKERENVQNINISTFKNEEGEIDSSISKFEEILYNYHIKNVDFKKAEDEYTVGKMIIEKPLEREIVDYFKFLLQSPLDLSNIFNEAYEGIELKEEEKEKEIIKLKNFLISKGVTFA